MRTGAKEIYDSFLIATDRPWCWRCGRGAEDKPEAYWFGPWLIERHHIVSKPRVDDRRAAILLCSLCHKLAHGETIAGDYEPALLLLPMTLPEAVGLKRLHDLEFYDRLFLAKHCVGLLPVAAAGPAEVIEIYTERRGL